MVKILLYSWRIINPFYISLVGSDVLYYLMVIFIILIIDKSNNSKENIKIDNELINMF